MTNFQDQKSDNETLHCMNKIVTSTSSFIIGLVLLTTGCSGDSTAEATNEAKAESLKLEGSFSRISDNDRAGNISGNFTLIHNITFTTKNCSFECAGVKVTGTYRTDNKFVYIETGTELGTLKMEMKSNDVFEGEGWIHGTFSTHGTMVAGNDTAMGDENNGSTDGNSSDGVVINTQSNSGSNSSNSGNTNDGNNSEQNTNTSNGTVTGSGGDGDNHVSSYETRKLVKLPDFSDVMAMIKSDIKVTLKLALDQKGNVLYANPIASKTNTTDEKVLSKVKSLVQQQAKFTPVYTKKTMEIEYSFSIEK